MITYYPVIPDLPVRLWRDPEFLYLNKKRPEFFRLARVEHELGGGLADDVGILVVEVQVDAPFLIDDGGAVAAVIH